MITVSQAFKEASKKVAQYIATVTDGVDPITESDDLQSIVLKANGSLCSVVMRQADIQFIGNHDYPKGTELTIQIGLYLQDTVDKGAVTLTIASPCVATLNAHGLNTGDVVRISTDGTLPTGLTENTDYYAIYIDENTFNLATTLDNANNGVKLNTSGSQSGTHNLTYYVPGIGSTPEYITFGTFIVDSQTSDEGSDQKTLICFDKMSEADIPYALSTSYPKTLLTFLQAVCSDLGWTLATTTFPNYDQTISAELFTEQGLTYRQVLNQVAEISGCVMRFATNDELVLIEVDEVSLETLDSSSLNTLEVEEHYGEINSVILARTPQEDNIAQRDEDSITANGLTEFKIENNQIADSDRETWIGDVFSALFGIDFYPYTAETAGLGYFEIGDRITLVDPDDNSFGSYVFDWEIRLTGGLRETIGAKDPLESETAYEYAGIIGQVIKNTQIIVNKQEGIITSTVSTLESVSVTAQQAATQSGENADDIAIIQGDVTELQQTADALELAIQGIGGSNLLKNSVGLKGDIKDWQKLDAEGDPIDARNDGTIASDADVRANSESGSAISITDQYIEQTLPTIIGETYTVYNRFKKTSTTNLYITGVEGAIPLSGDNNEWTVFKYQFVATNSSTAVRYETSTGITCLLSDMVVKLGDCSGWTQAPNEVYGANFRFDRDGFSITSLTSTFKTVLDNEQLVIYDTAGGGKIIAVFSKDYGKITDLTVQDSFQLQRYDTPSPNTKMIATSTGAILVINN